MHRIMRVKQSPAILIAIVALVVALAGPAVAELATTSLNKRDAKKVKKIARKQANRQIKRAEPSLDVNSAKTARSANPIAFAHVEPGGGVVESESKNVADGNVSTVASSGVYCFGDLGFALKGAVVMVEHPPTPFDQLKDVSFALGDPHSKCASPGSQATVYTYDSGGLIDNGFFISFFN